MSLAPGIRLGPYEVLGPLGAGGMGEVYRARDPRIGREVALKVLPASVSEDADRLRRFEQEARATGQLNHPNILAVHDVGGHGGAPYVVSELLEGDTLRERIGGTPLPVRKAIDYATQIARGLAAAHEKGVVHRDLKPDNVFVTRDGRVKILDFGLAKLVEGDVLAEAETHTRGAEPGTDAGRVLGTVGYMSPEQVRAQTVDHRSDIFSFGSVLYEMLSGRRAFRGASNVETMNAILKEDPPELGQTNRQLPPALERIVSHCLEKSLEERFQSARDIAFDLEQLSGSAAHTALVAPAARALPLKRVILYTVLVVCLAGSSYLAGFRALRKAPTFRRLTFQDGLVNAARFVPDGETIVHSAGWRGSEREIYVTQQGSPESRKLDLKGSRLASVSRNGELLIYRPKRGTVDLARVPMSGGAPRELLERTRGADWAPDGASIAVVRETGNRVRLEFPIGKPLHESVSLTNLRVSPKGDLVAFTEHPLPEDARGDVAIVDLAGRKRTLSPNWSDLAGVAWSPDGSEVWFAASREGSENALHAVDLWGRERLVLQSPGDIALYDTAPDGRTLIAVQRRRPELYGRAPGETRERDLSWLDFGWVKDISGDGRALLFQEAGDGGGPDYGAFLRRMDGSPPVRLGDGYPTAISPDGRWALVVRLAPPMQAELLPVAAGEPRVLPRGPLVHIQSACFLPDGKRVVLSANEEGHAPRLYIQDLEGGPPKPFTAEGVRFSYMAPPTPDGAFVAAVSDRQISLYPTAGGEPRRVPGTETGDEPLRISDDGRFLFVRAPDRRPARIFRIDFARGARALWKELDRENGGPGAWVGSVTLTPDGEGYAYSFFDPTSTLYLAEGLR